MFHTIFAGSITPGTGASSFDRLALSNRYLISPQPSASTREEFETDKRIGGGSDASPYPRFLLEEEWTRKP